MNSPDYHIHELVKFFTEHDIFIAEFDSLLTACAIEMCNTFDANKNIYPFNGKLRWNLGIERYRQRNNIQISWKILSYLYYWAEED
jgi:hypothetical protein